MNAIICCVAWIHNIPANAVHAKIVIVRGQAKSSSESEEGINRLHTGSGFYINVTRRKGFVCIFILFRNENKGVAGTLPGEQQSTGLLHLIVRVPSVTKKEKQTSRKGYLLFW